MSRLLIDEYPLLVSPSLAGAIGLNEALVLQQVWFWTSLDTAQVRDGHRWVYNTYEAWQRQFPFWSIHGIRKIITRLVQAKLLIVGEFNKSAMDHTRWYRVDADAVQAAVSDVTRRDTSSVPAGHIICPLGTHLTTETTTETTTEITAPASPTPPGSPEDRSSGELSNHLSENQRGVGSEKSGHSLTSRPKKTTLRDFLIARFGKVEASLPDDDPIYLHAASVRMSRDIVELYWCRFCNAYLVDRTDKKYTNWLQTFRNALKEDWFGLYYHDQRSGAIQLTSKGRISQSKFMEQA